MLEQDQRRNGSRDVILKVLWNDDIARVDPALTPARLQRGDEFVDLQRLELGVQYALRATAPVGGVLPRKSVQAQTWARILEQL